VRTIRVAIVTLILGGLLAPAAASAEGWGSWLGGDSKEKSTTKKPAGGKSWWNSQSKKKKDDGFFSLVRGDEDNKAAQRKAVTTARGRKPEPKPTFWETLFGKEEEPKQPQTVKEWMAQPRVGS
jgi:hypothetical protein